MQFNMITCFFEDKGKAYLRHVVTNVIVANQDDQILLVKRGLSSINGGKWGLPGGFVDRDETVKQAAEREILEETGYKISEVNLLKIIDNPNRAHEDRQNILFVYTAKATEKIGEGDIRESSEITWFNLNKLPEKKEFAFDHYEIIQEYIVIKK